VGIELDARATVVAEHAHRQHRLDTPGRDVLPDADLPQKRDIARAERVDPSVECAVPRRRSDAPLLRYHGRTHPARSDREEGADGPAADDDQVMVPVYNRG